MPTFIEASRAKAFICVWVSFFTSWCLCLLNCKMGVVASITS